MTYRGRIRNGMVVFDPPVTLPEGAEVNIQTTSPQTPPLDDQIPTLYERLKSVIGIAEGLPTDMAENHDHYIHGAEKQ